MSDAVSPIPTLEQFPVTGEPGALTVQAGGLTSTSRVLAGQGQQIRAISSALAPNWRGEAASSYQALSSQIGGAFASAATAIEGAALLMLRYAAELERLQAEARAAAQQSEHWHQEIVTWTGKVNEAQTALTRAQTALAAAQRQLASAVAQGPKGAAAAAAAGAAVTRAQGEVRTAQTELIQARQQLKNAHDQFTLWQDRARRIRDAAMTAGEELGVALLLVTVVPPPLPGTPDYPALEPTPGILLNNETGNGEQGNGGKDQQGGGDGAGSGSKGQGEGTPPKTVTVGPDGKIVQPPRPETKPQIGDRKQEQVTGQGLVDRAQGTKPKPSGLVAVLRLIGQVFGHPPPPPSHPG